MGDFGFGFFAQDVREAMSWGVLGRRNLRMRFRDLVCEWFSSQGIPVQELQERDSRDVHGWMPLEYERLGERWKRPVFRNSSTPLFLLRALCFKGLFFCLTLGLPQVVFATSETEKVQEVANNFEALLLNQLYSQMDHSGRWVDVGDDNPFAPTQAQRIFEGFRNQEILKNLAARRPLGVAALVERQLTGQNGVDRSRIHNTTLLESNRQRQESQTSTEESIHGRDEAQKR